MRGTEKVKLHGDGTGMMRFYSISQQEDNFCSCQVPKHLFVSMVVYIKNIVKMGIASTTSQMNNFFLKSNTMDKVFCPAVTLHS
jgi:hypothetical protein